MMKIEVEYEVVDIAGEDQIDALIDSLRDIVKRIAEKHQLHPIRIEVRM